MIPCHAHLADEVMGDKVPLTQMKVFEHPQRMSDLEFKWSQATRVSQRTYQSTKRSSIWSIVLNSPRWIWFAAQTTSMWRSIDLRKPGSQKNINQLELNWKDIVLQCTSSAFTSARSTHADADGIWWDGFKKPTQKCDGLRVYDPHISLSVVLLRLKFCRCQQSGCVPVFWISYNQCPSTLFKDIQGHVWWLPYQLGIQMYTATIIHCQVIWGPIDYPNEWIVFFCKLQNMGISYHKGTNKNSQIPKPW